MPTSGNYARQPDAARIVRTTTQSIPSTAFTDIVWESADFDTVGTMFEAAGLRIPYAGLWRVTASIQWSITATNLRISQIVSGTTVLSYAREQDTNGFIPQRHGSVLRNLNAGDLLRIQVWQNTGSPTNIEPLVTTGGPVDLTATFVRAAA